MTWGLARSVVIYNAPWALRRWARFYKGLVDPGDLVFDVGAHVGNRTRALQRAGACVVAVEPQAPFTGFLKRTLPRGVTVLDVAVGRERTQTELSVSSRHPTVSTLSKAFVEAGKTSVGFEHVAWDRSQVVEVVPLDDLIAQYGVPRYVKVDVEGGEADVLAGLSHPVAIISVEYLPAMPELTFALVDQLIAMGNTHFNLVVGERAAFLWADWRDGDAVKAWLRAQDPGAKSGDLFARRPSGASDN